MVSKHLVGAAAALAVALAVLPAGIAHAAPPLVTTEPATNVLAYSATFNGSLTTAGEPVKFHFEWGLTDAYGNVTIDVPATGADPVLVEAGFTGLSPATTYHYRLVGVDADGTLTPGADMAFTTAAVVSDPGTTVIQWTSAPYPPAIVPSTSLPPIQTIATPRVNAKPASSAKVTGTGVAQLSLTCPVASAGATCEGALTLAASTKVKGRTKTVAAGSASYSVVSGAKPTVVSVKLSAAARKLLTTSPSHKLRVVATMTSSNTAVRPSTRTITLAGPKPKRAHKA